VWKTRKLKLLIDRLGGRDYYVVEPDAISELKGLNVRFDGIITEKPVIEYYAAGWPWSLASRFIEEDHGHRTILKVEGVTVYIRGSAPLRKSEKVRVWGKVRRRL